MNLLTNRKYDKYFIGGCLVMAFVTFVTDEWHLSFFFFIGAVVLAACNLILDELEDL